MKQIVAKIMNQMPDLLFYRTMRVLSLVKIDGRLIEQNRIRQFAWRLKSDFDKEIKKILKNKRVMRISFGEYEYSSFNAYYLNNMIGLIFYALYRGCIPVIEVNKEKTKCVNWDWYFVQPIVAVWGGNVDLSDFEIIKCQLPRWNPPEFSDAFELKSDRFDFYNFMYSKFVVLNREASEYVNREWEALPDGKKVAILIRGTDYVSLKPKGHPRQPSVETIISTVQKESALKGYEYYYIATEEQKLFDQIAESIGKQFALSNSRQYYDEYWNGDYHEIWQVRKNRENDTYLRGLEYLSSMMIVSRCDGFVGGNCGGTLMAMLFAQNHDNAIVINEGLYS